MSDMGETRAPRTGRWLPWLYAFAVVLGTVLGLAAAVLALYPRSLAISLGLFLLVPFAGDAKGIARFSMRAYNGGKLYQKAFGRIPLMAAAGVIVVDAWRCHAGRDRS